MFLRALQDPNAHKLDYFTLFLALKNNQPIYLIPAVSHPVSLSLIHCQIAKAHGIQRYGCGLPSLRNCQSGLKFSLPPKLIFSKTRSSRSRWTTSEQLTILHADTSKVYTP